MESSPSLLIAVVLFLFTVVTSMAIAQRLGIGAVLGYLAAGIAISPWGLGFICDVDEILHFRSWGGIFDVYHRPGTEPCQTLAFTVFDIQCWRCAGGYHRGVAVAALTFSRALKLGRKVLQSLGMHPHHAYRAQHHFCRLDMSMLRELMHQPQEEGRHSSRIMEARRELEDISQREMQQERRLLDGWGEDEQQGELSNNGKV